MPIYSRITIAFSPAEEKEIKQAAKEQGKSVSKYCREMLLGNVEQPLNRVTIESEIDELRKSIDIVNKNMMILSKKILQDTQMSSNLVQGFFNVVIEDDETKYNIYKEAEEETKEYMSKIFGK